MRAGWLGKILQRPERSVWTALPIGAVAVVLPAYSAYMWKAAIQNGLGLGLPLSRSFSEAHGGRLWATPNPDGGVAFRFTLPLNTGANRDGSRTNRIRRG